MLMNHLKQGLHNFIDELTLQRPRLFIYAVALFAAGIATYIIIPFNVSAISLYMSFCCIALLWWVFSRKELALSQDTRSDIPYRIVKTICLIVLVLLTGMIRAHWQVSMNDMHFLTQVKEHVKVEGVITAIEEQEYQQTRLTIALSKTARKGETEILQNIRLKWHGVLPAEIKPHCTIEAVATLLPVSSPVSPVGYPFKRDYFFKRISATGVIHSFHLKACHASSIDQWRHDLTKTIKANMHKPYGEIAAALITGDRSGIPQVIRNQFSDSGLAHLLAISGLHMSLVAGLLFFVFFKLLCTVHLVGLFTKRTVSPTAPLMLIASMVTMSTMFFYLLISGSGYPAIRSFLMIMLVWFALMLGRNPISLRSVALVAFAILLTNPYSLFSLSFQLSFSAVIALVAFYEYYTTLKPPRKENASFIAKIAGHFTRYVGVVVLTTFIATLATTPIGIAVFNRFTMQAILANILAIPLTAFWIMPMAVMSMFFLVFGGWDVAFLCFEWGIVLLCDIAKWVAQLPGAIILVASPTIWYLPVLMTAGLLICVGPLRCIRISGLCLLAVLPIAFHKLHVPVGYVAADKSVMAFLNDYTPYDIALKEPVKMPDCKNILWVSSLVKGKFFTQQWAQHLGVPLMCIQKMPSQLGLWKGYTLLADPFKQALDTSLKTYSQKKQFIKDAQQQICQLQDCSQTLISNAKLAKTKSTSAIDVVYDGANIEHNKGLFIFEDGHVEWGTSMWGKRPWS